MLIFIKIRNYFNKIFDKTFIEEEEFICIPSDKISLLVQGPFNQLSIESISANKNNFNQIVYSTWSKPDLSKMISKIELKNIHWVISEIPDVTNICNKANIYYQICNTLEGLKKIKTEYVFKHRSDEMYNNLDLVVKKFKQ